MNMLIKGLPPLDPVMMNAFAFRIANRAIVSDIENEGTRIEMPDGTVWWDILLMVDPNEHSSEVIDMAGEALAYAFGCELIYQHPNIPHLVRINEAMRRNS